MSRSSKSTTAPSLVKFTVSDREILNKRIHSNPRYSNVKARTDTGFNASKRHEIEREIRAYYKVQPDEVFRRISLNDLVSVIVAHAEEREACETNLYQGRSLQKGSHKETCTSDGTPETQVPNNLQQVSSVDDYSEYPYLILDVRPSSEYATSHLISSVSHPVARLNRAVGWECSEMLQYKNHPFWIIVLYDEFEDIAPQAAAILIHRGYNNVFVLSGGLKLAADKLGSPLVTDSIEKGVPYEVAEILKERISIGLVPPINMEEAEGWWNEERGGMSRRVMKSERYLRKLTQQEEKVPPWR